jgi:hypothetical protein
MSGKNAGVQALLRQPVADPAVGDPATATPSKNYFSIFSR